MSLSRWNKRARRVRKDTRSAQRRAVRPKPYHPLLEALEDRLAPAVLPPLGLVSWYRAENNANDFVGGNNGALQNGATFAAGQVQQAFSFDGVDDFVRVPDPANGSLDITGDLTIDAWINPTVITGGQRQIASKRSVDGNDVNISFFLQATGQLAFAARAGGGAFEVSQTTAAVPAGQLTHVAVTIQGTALTLYINGTASSFTSTTARPTNNGPFTLGVAEINAAGQAPFAGLIDEVDVYNRALSTAEIQGIVTAGSEGKATVVVDTVADTVAADGFTSLREAINFSETTAGRDVIGFSVPRPFTNGLVSWYRAEGNANDTSNGNNGTLTNGATATAVGRYRQAFNFDGVDDFVELGTPANLMPTNTDFTVEGWIQVPDYPTVPTPLCGPLYPIIGFESGWILSVDSTGRVGFGKYFDPINGVGASSASPISTNTFHHVAGVHTPSELRIYVDGVLAGSTASPTGTIFYQPGDTLKIGRQACGNGLRFYKGQIDELGFFNRALSSAEIQTIATGPRTISPTSALPTLTQSAIIDGYTQPGAVQNSDPTGFNGNLLIELNGASAGNASGLTIDGGNTTVRGLVVNRFLGRTEFEANGILLRSDGNRIEGNFIGTDATGLLPRPNANFGVNIVSSSNNIVGGTTPQARNVVSGNAFDGVAIRALNGVRSAMALGNVVQGNFIGTGANGVDPLGNGRFGVLIGPNFATASANDNVIGGAASGAGNRIAFNTSVGVSVGATLGTITGNAILSNAIFSNGGLGIDLTPNNGVTPNDIGDGDTGTNRLQNFPVLTQIIATATQAAVQGTLNSTASRTFGIEFFANQFPDASCFGEGQTFLGAVTVTDGGAGDTDARAGFVSLSFTANGDFRGQYLTMTATDTMTNDTSEFSLAYPVTSFVVTNTADGGPGSLRQAITCGNTVTNIDRTGDAVPDQDMIVFNIPGAGVHTITPTSALPTITDPVIIDGYTQPGASPNTLAVGNDAVLLIELNLNGTPFANALTITAGNSTVRGLVINRFNGGTGLLLQTGGGNTITGNFIGTNAAGTAALGTGVSGLFISSAGNQIGGTTAAARNVIAMNNGIGIALASNTVQGNYIGTNAAGTAVLVPAGNSGFGVDIQQFVGGIIGGTVPGAGNVIAGFAVGIRGTFVSGSFIQGNYIGTNPAGAAGLGNGIGIFLQGNANNNNNTIGGTAAGAGNVISGNTGSGVLLTTGAISNNLVQGNLIGLAPDGTTPLGNGGHGVEITGDNNIIGGVAAGAGNRIAFNGGDGVYVNSGGGLVSTGNSILGNSIYSNTGLGIDLGVNGVNPNDAGDADTGPNNLQNYPALMSARVNTVANTTTVQYSFNSTASTTGYRLEFFSSSAADPSGFGEGQVFLGSQLVDTGASGSSTTTSFTFSPALPLGRYITATATDPANNTSEFSNMVCAAATDFIQVTNTNDSGPGSLRQAILDSNASVGVLNTISFCIPGAGVHTIAPTSALNTITDPVIIDGYTQDGNGDGVPDAQPNTLAVGNDAVLLIELNGALIVSSASGLNLGTGSNGSTIRGLVINRFTFAGISLERTDGSTIAGNFIGTDPTGTVALGNGTAGIGVASPHQDVSNTVIGGTTPAARNVIVGTNGSGQTGVSLTQASFVTAMSGNRIQGNYIGLNAAGTARLGIFNTGMSLYRTTNTLVGGDTVATRNVVAGSQGSNIELLFSRTTTIQGNHLGTNAAGTVALPVAVLDGKGIIATGDMQLLIGGGAAGQGNLISGHNHRGIWLTFNPTGVVIQGNRIGTDAAGTAPLGNLQAGIYVDGANGVLIGGTTAGEGNIIAFNVLDGVFVPSGTGNIIQGNSIFANGSTTSDLGIDLGSSGVTANDAGDADTGANNLQNFPRLTALTATAASTMVQGTLNSTAGRTFRIEFFANPLADLNCFGEGQTFLGSVTVTDGGAGDTDPSAGNVSFGFTATGDFRGQYITMTATDQTTNDTSEFSLAYPVTSFVVTNTADSGPGSLRQAISCANAVPNIDRTGDAVPDLDMIVFNIPGAGVRTISPTSGLPTITDPAIIDGYTQPGASANTNSLALGSGALGINATLLIEINGASAGDTNGLSITAGNSTVRGLVINRFAGNLGNAISMDTAGNNVIEGNFIGTDPSGTLDRGNGGAAVTVLSGATNNRIGGTTPGARNLIAGNDRTNINISTSGNLIQGNFIGTTASGAATLLPSATSNADGFIVQTGGNNNTIGGTASGAGNLIAGVIDGIEMQGGTGTLVQGNFIGTDRTGTVALRNYGVGVFLFNATAGATVGGTTAAARNLIAGSQSSGIFLGGTAAGTVVQGNYIGTNVTGTAALANAGGGVVIGSGSGFTIGGTTPGAGNVISGNTGSGVQVGISGGASSGNFVLGNFIGTQADGISPLGNTSHGVSVGDLSAADSNNNEIGGVAAGASNTIAFNGGDGVFVARGSANPILGNRIFANTGLGIDLNVDGVNANDANDADTGANNLQNYPVITSVVSAGGTTTVQGTLRSTASTIFRVEIFGNTAGDPSGFGEGQFFLGTPSAAVTTDASGNATFTASFATPAQGGNIISATATNPGNSTSEFGCSLVVTTTADSGTGSLRGAIQCANTEPGADTITFNIPTDDLGHVYYLNDNVAGQVSLANLTATTAATDAALVNPDPDWANSWWTIRPATALPNVSEAVVIDAYTQPGASQNTNDVTLGLNSVLRIEINGAGADANGVSTTTGSSTVRGLVINRFGGNNGSGILLSTTGNAVEGNYLGTDVSGTLDLGDQQGVRAFASNNTIGGLTPAARNLISGNNNSGVSLLSGPGNQVQGNLIGTDRTGTLNLGNAAGISGSSSGNTIGGTAAGSRNVISGNGTGISLQGSNWLIQGNYIGTNAAGTAAIGNTLHGAFVFGGTNNMVGGTTAAARNVISGNSFGISIAQAPSTIVQGNYIGTNAAGTASIGNTTVGIQVVNVSDNTTVVGNLISGNRNPGAGVADGLWVGVGDSATSTGVVIQGNFVGTDVTGTLDLGNEGIGVNLGSNARTVTLGGTTAAARNVISGNDGAGVSVGAAGQTIRGNFIGTQMDGTSALGNGSHGILIAASNTVVGGTGAGEPNTVAFNAGDGVFVSTVGAVGNSILSNSIFSNTELGIDLLPDGVTANDEAAFPFDTDTGANNRQNFPVLTQVVATATQVTVNGTLRSTTSGTFRIELFANTAADPSGNGEGQTLLTSFLAADNDNDGIVAFTSIIPGDFRNRAFSATATNTTTSDTSEFSVAVSAGCSLVVVNTNDSGAGSLREAINCANSTTGTDTISFNIPGSGVHTISPTSALPTITDPAIIDGYTQTGAVRNSDPTGFNGNLLIELNGANAGNASGLTIDAGNSTVRGLVVNRFLGTTEFIGNGILVRSDGNRIEGNFIGTDSTGLLPRPNALFGVNIVSSSNNIVGGTTPQARNVLSANAFEGVAIRALNGVRGAVAVGNVVQGNFIGTGANGVDPLGNSRSGVDIGVNVASATTNDNVIGGAASGAGNRIAFNSSFGVRVGAPVGTATGNAILSNAIFSNGGLGIDLSPNGVTPNDMGDGDTGTNNLQNFPLLTAITATATSTMVQGTLNSTAGRTFRVEFFANQFPDASCFGEGQTFLGAVTVTDGGAGDTDARAGFVSLSFTATGDFRGQYLTMTATDTTTNDTSEFSLAYPVTSFVVTNTADGGPGSLRQAITCANMVTNIDRTGDAVADPDSITFNIPGAGVRTISPTSALPTITEAVIIDGYTQPGAVMNSSATGFNGTLLIELNGTSAGAGVAGLTITTSSSTVRGLVINRFDGSGILIMGSGSTGNLVQGNFIGTNGAGTAALANTGSGVFITASAKNNTIGGTTAAARNLLSGNTGSGVELNSDQSGITSGNLVQGNYIGTNAAGTGPLGNTFGVFIHEGAQDNTIGGTATGAGNVISGNTSHGITIFAASATGNRVQGNLIGTNAAGTAALPNDSVGVRIGGGAQNNTIGGTATGARNVISGNSNSGVFITEAATGNVVQGNFLGTNPAGTAALGNDRGITIGGAMNTTVGGTTAAARNIISGNFSFGVVITDPNTTGNLLQGNFIGTNAAGDAPLPNQGEGVLITASADGNTVGGPAAGAGNVISGNSSQGGANGVSLAANGNLVQGNFIGTDAAGTGALGNFGYGVDVRGGFQNNTITANRIAFNGEGGVRIRAGTTTGNAILGNAIFINTGLGIDLNGDGVTLNDLGDADTGGNNLQNFPIITAASASGADTLIQGRLNSLASTGFRIDLFVNDARDPSGFGEGQTFLGSTNVTTNPAGNAAISFTATGLIPAGRFITATATRLTTGSVPVETSEFSAAACSLIVTTTSDGGLGSLREAISCANAVPNVDHNGDSIVDPDEISFALPGAGVRTISPTAALPTISEAVSINGYTQTGAVQNTSLTGFNGTLLIELNGTNARSAAGLILSGHSGSTVRGLIVNRFGGDGVRLVGGGGHRLEGNYIGTDNTGALDRRNFGAGVLVNTSSDNTIGGTSAGAHNIIAFNGTIPGGGNGTGVAVESGTGNRILGNSIFSSAGLGIDLTHNGVTPNDTGDGDTGANNLQNFPLLTSARTTGTSITIQGTLNSRSSRTFRLEFFANAAADDTGFGEGQTFLGSLQVATNNQGNVLGFTAVLSVAVPVGQFVTATATISDPETADLTDTSEFSGAILVTLANRPPDAMDDLPTIDEDTPAIIDVRVNDSDPDLDPVTVTAVTQGASGRVVLNANQTISYTPNADFNGTDSFTYTISDGQGNSDTATVRVIVRSVNDAPQFTMAGNPPAVNEDAGLQMVTAFATAMRPGPATASDEVSQSMAFSVTVLGTTGNLGFSTAPSINGAGTLTFATAPDANGTATIQVILSDSGSGVLPNVNTSATQTFTITVNAVNDAPQFRLVAPPPPISEDAGPQSFANFAANVRPGPVTATDEAGQGLAFTLTVLSTTGSLAFSVPPALTTNPTLTFTAAPGTSGTATVQVVLIDNGSGVAPNVNVSAPQLFTITVTPRQTPNTEGILPLVSGIQTPPPGYSLDFLGKALLLGSGMNGPNGTLAQQVNFVFGLYGNLLNRLPDTVGLSHWILALRTGASRFQVAQAIWQSPEQRGREVDHFYRVFLHRQADPGGRAVWISSFQAGASEVEVIRAFLTSTEYGAAHANNDTFVIGLYADVLGRAADAGGRAFWGQALQNGASRAAVADAFLTSAEANKQVLDAYYAAYFGRHTDPLGEQVFLPSLQSRRVSFEGVAELLLASDEYFARR